MGYIGVEICDLCGKRTSTFAGKLILNDIQKKYHCYVERSWKLCKKCFNHMGTTQTAGDLIREELELKLDKIRIDKSKIQLLN